jgi:lipopolysaccharide transport system permease protein
MPAVTVHTSAPALATPGKFFSAALRDLRVSARTAGQLFAANVRTRYRRAWLAYLWLFVPPLGTTAIALYVQSHRIVPLAATAVPYAVYVLSGTILWQVFSDALQSPLQQLTAGRQMIARSRVPHEALMLAGMYEVLLGCAVRLLILVPVLVLYHVAPTRALLLVPAGILALALLGAAFGVVVAPFGVLYDDVAHALPLLTAFGFFLTPVVYPASRARILQLNPVTPLLESTRAWLTGGSASAGFVSVTLAAIVVLAIAWILQRVARPHVVARLG